MLTVLVNANYIKYFCLSDLVENFDEASKNEAN